jgi:hypothetical protein
MDQALRKIKKATTDGPGRARNPLDTAHVFKGFLSQKK